MNQSPLEIAGIAAAAAEDKKARDVKTLQIKELSIITDYFVICSANSTTQVKAIADNIEEKLEEQDIRVLHREGMREGRWILLDYGSVVVHVFQEDERTYYNLERLWGDAKTVEV
ncbi:MAG TPA: ribosome silencing factor [Bacillota bacterium]|nr:ribosome silencing factor [Bacillota bacterium]